MPKSELSDAQPPPPKPAGGMWASLAKKEGGKPSQHQAFKFIKCVEGDDTAANYQDVATKCG